MTRLVAIADTHGSHYQMRHPIPECDILIHAGDITSDGSMEALADSIEWLDNQPAKYKVLIAGNHDWAFEKFPLIARKLVREKSDIIYLQEESEIIMGLKVFGSPWSPFFLNWAFNAYRGEDIRKHWEKIPKNTDILITHCPSFGWQDELMFQHLGCKDLFDKILEIQPTLHIHGHIHAGYGQSKINHADFGNSTTVVNASVCTEGYIPFNKPIEINL